jgi:hypothetical protein
MIWFQNLTTIGKIGSAVLFLGMVGLIGGALYLWVRQILELRYFQDLALKDRIVLKLELTKTAAQILGGAFFLLTIYITWQNLAATLEKNQAEREKNQTDLALVREKQLTDLYVEAIKQLGQPEMAVRLGGIYALDRLARSSAKDKGPILEVLTAYVREESVKPFRPVPAANSQTAKNDKIWPRTDVQAILTVIAGLGPASDPEGKPQSLDLRHTDLRGAELLGAILPGALLWDSRLEDVHLPGANLAGADLRNARLAGSHLHKANLDQANLQGADLKGANLIQTSLRGANLAGADLRQALGLTQAQVDTACCDESTKLPPALRPSGNKPPPATGTCPVTRRPFEGSGSLERPPGREASP